MAVVSEGIYRKLATFGTFNNTILYIMDSIGFINPRAGLRHSFILLNSSIYSVHVIEYLLGVVRVL